MKVEKNLDPTSLVARIIAELQANPEAQQMLLRAMLTNEFLGVPARLDRIEKDVAELKADMAEVKTNVARLTKDVDLLKGSDLEHRLNRKIRALASQRLKLRGIEAIQTPGQWPNRDFLKAVEEALEDGRITAEQGSRIDATDFILNARRIADRVPVWIAIEASHTVHGSDINRARASADALRAVFRTDVVAVAAGYRINAANTERAKAAGVAYLGVPPPQPE